MQQISKTQITHDRAKSWNACPDGYRWFVKNYPQPEGAEFTVLYKALIADGRLYDANWLAEKLFAELIGGERNAAIVKLVRSEIESATTGDAAHAATTGARAHAATTGARAHAATTGDAAHAATTGDYAHAATTGYAAHAATTGYAAHAATTGDYAHAATTGYAAHAATTGYAAHAATTGDYAHAATTGYAAHAATTGDYAHAATTGDGAHAATTGDGAVAVALGCRAKARAKAGAIMLTEHDTDGRLIAVAASMVGQNGVEPGVWYELRDGQITRCDEQPETAQGFSS